MAVSQAELYANKGVGAGLRSCVSRGVAVIFQWVHAFSQFFFRLLLEWVTLPEVHSRGSKHRFEVS